VNEDEKDRKQPEYKGPTLIVKGGPTDGATCAVDPGNTILVGSGHLAHLRVDHPDVGGAHIRVSWDDFGLWVTDNGSASGTFINGEPVVTGPLRDGDRISFVPTGSKANVPKILVRIPQGTVVIAAPPPEPDLASQGDVHEPPEVPRTAARTFLPKIAVPSPPRLRMPSLDLSALTRPPALYVLGGGGGLLVLLLAIWLVSSLLGGKPTVAGVTPPKAAAGQSVQISGKAFAKEAAKNTVRFGEAVASVAAATDRSLTVTVPAQPAGAKGRDSSITVETAKGRSNPIPFRYEPAPSIAGLEPDVAESGNDVLVKAEFAEDAAATVTVAGKPAEVLETQPGAIRIRVPALDQQKGAAVPVVLKVGQLTSPPFSLLVGQPPLIVSVEPSTGVPGDRVKIKGGGFSPDPAGDAVTFFGVPALVLSASQRELEVVVPGISSSGTQGEVRVQCGNRVSDAGAYTVTRPSSNQFSLRFFAAAASGASREQALVATDIGPLFLLTSKADAPSTAERAARVAAALNRLLDELRTGKAVALEVRPGGQPTLAVQGASDVLVAATPEDLAAYTTVNAPAAKKGVPPSLTNLANLWLALLDDHLSLFERKERPLKLLGLSPQGKTVTDLISALGWRPGDAVSRGAVDALPESMRTRWRELAFTLPVEGQAGPASAATAAIEGTWEGTLQDETGDKTVIVRLEKAGKGLAGSLASKSQGLTLEVKLQDVTYGGGVLTFVAPLAGSPRTFAGKIEAGVLTGTVHKGPASSPATGRFSLRFAP
jgi:hypothetical protein